MSSLSFPYMFWARSQAARTAHPLSQSGMPLATAELLNLSPDPEADLLHPMEYLGRLEARLGAHLGVPAERVIVTGGATGALHLAALSTFPESHVVADHPCYEPFRALAELYGRTTSPLERRPEDGWALDPDALARALFARSGPAHLFACNPHNPTGVLVPAETIREAAARVADTDGVLVVNETYMEFLPPQERYHAAGLAPNTMSLGSLTKAYGLGSLRLGWVALGEGLAGERERILDRQYLCSVDLPSSSLRAGLHALENLTRFDELVRRVERESRPIFERWLADEELVEGTMPAYGICAFPKVHGVRDTRALSEHLAHREEVDVVPGEFFGSPGHLRVGFGLAPEVVEGGLANLSRGLRSFAARS